MRPIFLPSARILQFQFHRSLCQTAGYEGPLNRCSIYGNKEAGARLNRMLEMGQSHPWPDALEVGTGQRQMDATANHRLLQTTHDVARYEERGPGLRMVRFERVMSRES